MTEPDTKVRALLDELATEARLDPASERSTLRRSRRHRVAGGFATVVVAVAVVTGGLMVAATVGPRSAPADHPRPSAAVPTPTPAPSPVQTPAAGTPTSEPAGPVFATDLEDGRYIAFATHVDQHTNPNSLRFDLAIYLTGDEANQYAADHGMGVPVPNDNIIVNENPRLRLMPLADDVEIDVIAYGDCGPECGPNETLDVDEFGDLIGLDEPLADGVHVGRTAPYWLTIRDGRIVKIEEQYQP